MATESHSVIDIATHQQPPASIEREQQPALTLFAAGLVGMGTLALVVGDFALVWQPVALWVPGRTAAAYGSGVLMVACGFGLMFRKTSRLAVRILFPYLIAWQLLKLPDIVAAPTSEGSYLGFGELAILLAGGWTLFTQMGDVRAPRWLNWAVGQSGVRMARCYFAVWIIPIGLSHWIFLKPSVDLVPPWLPYKEFWAHLTGAGQIASGLGILFGVFPRAAALAEAIQISLYGLLIWLPAILLANRNLGPSFADADRRLSFTAFLITWIIGAGAWVVAQNVAPKSKPTYELNPGTPRKWVGIKGSGGLRG